MYYVFFMARKTFSVKLNTRFEGGVKPFWTEKEYLYQDLIVNGFVIQRELPGYSRTDIPLARVDIYYDGPNGLGQKRINGVEIKVYKEATKFLTRSELHEFNLKWTNAKYEGKYDHEDPLSRKDISDNSIPAWHKDPVAWKEKNKNTNYFDTPLQDIILKNNIDPKDLAADGGLSSLYNYIQGKRELPKNKAEEYAKLLGLAPQTLMFDTKMIPCWGNVNLHKQTADIHSNRYTPGEVRYNEEIYTVPCPAELYRYDIKAIQIDFDKTAYHGMIAYYYETNGADPRINNKICMVRTYQPLEDDKGNRFGTEHGYYKYFLGIYQIYGTKKRILNLDPTSDVKVIADDVDVDLIAPIVSLVRPAYMDIDAGLKAPSLDNVNKLKDLIAIDELNKKEQQKNSKFTEKLNQFISEKFYETEKEKKELRKQLDKHIVEMEKLKKQNDKIQAEVSRYFNEYTKEQEDMAWFQTQKVGAKAEKLDELFNFKYKDEKKRA